MRQETKAISGIMTAIALFSNITCGGVTAEEYVSANSPCYPMKCSAEYERPELYVCGTPFGIKLLTDGVIVTGFAKIGDSNNAFELSPAGSAGIEKGDVITSINGVKIKSSENMSELIAASGESAELTYTRDDTEYTATVEIKSDTDGQPRIGLWVRDSTAGIGTMTFYDPECGGCAGLGHAVCDVDTGEILPLGSGQIVPAVITGVRKGESNSPGELCGTLTPAAVDGNITDNCGCGLYAVTYKEDIQINAMPLAFGD